MDTPTLPEDLDFLWESPKEQEKFWTSLAPWFASRGYALYRWIPVAEAEPGKTETYHVPRGPGEFPYADVPDSTPSGRVFMPRVVVFPAVSEAHRDVMIKLIPRDFSEYSIVKFLMSESVRQDEYNTTIPILEVLEFDERWSFIVMPRWGCTIGIQRWGFGRVGPALEFILAMLKGLVFLHKHLIVHRDFKPSNILINCVNGNELADLRPFLDSGRAKFAITDFGLSHRFPPDTPPSERVCEAEDCNLGTFEYHPPDGTNGEKFYNPFAFDVACLGGLFCELVGDITPLVPPLAPFLDNMITHDISARCTAREALDAFIRLKDSISPESLFTPTTPRPILGPFAIKFIPWHAHDRWAGLPPEFTAQEKEKKSPVRPKRKLLGEDWITPYFQDFITDAK